MVLDLLAVVKDPDWLLVGLWGTLKLCLSTLLLAPPLGLLLCFGRLVHIRGLSTLIAAYVDAVRAIPTIVLLFWVYFALPVLVHVDFDPFEAATLTLTLQYAAFFCEIFRGGTAGVGAGQWDAAGSLGLSLPGKLRYVILPQALPGMLPPLFSHLIDLVKATSLASAITYADIMYEGLRVSAETFRPVEALTVVGLVYYVVSLVLSSFRAKLEQRFVLR